MDMSVFLREEKIHSVNEFKEKPNLETAKKYLVAGNYFWNTGILVWSANTITECISKYKPSIVEEMDAIIASEVSEISKVREIFPNVEKVSVVYAVMEPVSCIKGWYGIYSSC